MISKQDMKILDVNGEKKAFVNAAKWFALHWASHTQRDVEYFRKINTS